MDSSIVVPGADRGPPLTSGRSGTLPLPDRDGLARIGLVVLAAAIPLQRAAIIGAVGSTVMLLAVLVVPIALWAGWMGRDHGALLGNPLMLAVVLAWWAGATTFWTVDPESTATSFYRLLTMVAMAAAFLHFAREESFRLRLLNAYLLGCVVAGLIVIRQYLTTPTMDRASLSPDASINQVAFTLVLAMVPAAYLLARILRGAPGGQWRLFVYGTAYSTLGIAVLLSGSRSGAILTVLATLAAVLMMITAARTVLAAIKGITAILLLAVALMSALSLTEAPPMERILSPDRGGLEGEARAAIWRQAWTLSAERPLTGAGLALGVSFDEPGYSHVSTSVHNTHLQVFLELGAVGTALWLLLIAGVFRAAWRAPPLERLMWVAQLAVLFIGIGARGFIFGVPMWFFLGVAAALSLGSYRAGASQS